MSRFPYAFFDNFVVRTPLLSCKEFQSLFENQEDYCYIENIVTDNVFREALYLASPQLNYQIDKFTDNNLFEKESDKLKNTVLKYFVRASSRCTPFGLFSGAGLGHFQKDNSFPETYSERQKHRETKPDMHFLVSLTNHLLSSPNIKNSVLFFPNNSIYKVGQKIRYVEYENINGKRDYIVSSTYLSEELKTIIDASKKGKTIKELAIILVNEDISFEEAYDYIEELIHNQILVSELEPNVSGTDYFDLIISILSRINAERERDILISIQEKIKNLDKQFGNPVFCYQEIEKLIKSLNIEYEQKYLFQTDLYFKSKTALSYQWKKELKKGISFLNKITPKNKNNHFEKFKKAFYERFENEEVPLAYALDTEIGIGYRQDIPIKAVHSFLEDIILPVSKNNDSSLILKLNPIQVILNQKLQSALMKKEYTIRLCDEDFKEFQEDWNDLPDTMSFMAEMVSDHKKQKLCLNRGGGNASRLMARFCSEQSCISKLAKEICKKEEQANDNYILAEIIHLPESRIGNILRRPHIRNYEIPYMAKSLLPDEQKILVDDLCLSLRNDMLVLRSKKLNREVKPYLTNAHNYAVNSLPVYHFLCDFNAQNTRQGLHFDWGDLMNIYNFFPRVEYENIILSKAQWKVNSDEITQFISLLADKESLHQKIENWRNERNIPQWVQLVQADNILTINLNNYDLLRMFFLLVKNEKEILIEEFLHNEKENFAYQFIFPLYKNN